MYFSGDSSYFDGFKEIGERLGSFDFTMMECGRYSEFWPNIHMASEESVQAAIDVKSKITMPVNWGKFKLSLHSWNETPTRFTKKVKEQNLIVATLRIGATFTLAEISLQHWWH